MTRDFSILANFLNFLINVIHINYKLQFFRLHIDLGSFWFLHGVMMTMKGEIIGVFLHKIRRGGESERKYGIGLIVSL